MHNKCIDVAYYCMYNIRPLKKKKLPVNKYALIRYHALDKCFTNVGRNYFIEDLLEACNLAIFAHNEKASGIQRRQLFEDIKFMESANGWEIPLERCRMGKRVYYRYSDSKFSINKYPVSFTEYDKIKEVMFVLKRIKGIPEFSWIQKLYVKLEESFILQTDDHAKISFEQIESLRDLDFLGDLLNCLVDKRVLRVHYHPQESKEVCEWQIHPYYLKQFQQRWFLLGYNSGCKRLMSLSLDRIQSFEVVEALFVSPKLNFEAIEKYMYGAQIPSETSPTRLVLMANSNLTTRLINKPMHPTQKLISVNQEAMLFSLDVFPNEELENEILSHGENLILVEPEDLRAKIRQRLFEALGSYEKKTWTAVHSEFKKAN